MKRAPARVMAGTTVAALAAGLSLAACSSSPPARDVRACHMAAGDLNANDTSVNDYAAASAVAVSPQLSSDLSSIGQSLGAVASEPGALAGNLEAQANVAIRAAGRICTQDGVAWPAGDSMKPRAGLTNVCSDHVHITVRVPGLASRTDGRTGPSCRIDSNKVLSRYAACC